MDKRKWKRRKVAFCRSNKRLKIIAFPPHHSTISYREDTVVLFTVLSEQCAQLLGLDAQDGLSLLLEASDPNLAIHIGDRALQDHAPSEVVDFSVALLTPIEPVVLIEYLR